MCHGYTNTYIYRRTEQRQNRIDRIESDQSDTAEEPRHARVCFWERVLRVQPTPRFETRRTGDWVQHIPQLLPPLASHWMRGRRTERSLPRQDRRIKVPLRGGPSPAPFSGWFETPRCWSFRMAFARDDDEDRSPLRTPSVLLRCGHSSVRASFSKRTRSHPVTNPIDRCLPQTRNNPKKPSG